MSYIQEKNNYKKMLNNLPDRVVDYNKDNDCWGFIPIDFKYLKFLFKINERSFKKFIDLGCGVGNVLQVADNLGFEVTGVEYDKSFSKYLNKYDVIWGDLLRLELDLIKKYDVVYCYNPIKDNGEYLNKVVYKMKKHSFIIAPYNDFERADLKKVDIYTYQKI